MLCNCGAYNILGGGTNEKDPELLCNGMFSVTGGAKLNGGGGIDGEDSNFLF